MNVQQNLERIIEENKDQQVKPRLLVHSCCAPCSTYVLDYLKDSFQIVALFFNPNMDSDEEYQKAAMQARTELSAVQSQYSAQLKTLVDSAMADIAKDKKLSAIVEKDHIDSNPLGQAQKSEFVIQGGVDVTDDLIQKLQ